MLTLDRLTCDFLSEPLGIDNPKPLFSWQLNGNVQDDCQQAYHLQVTQCSDVTGGSPTVVWDSGQVGSQSTVAIEYDGQALRDTTKYQWNLSVFLSSGETLSATASFETAFLSQDAWQGCEWFGSPASRANRSLYFHADMTVGVKPVRARAYLAALGYGELHVNGERISTEQLNPAPTQYEKRVLYTTYDITDCLVEGSNGVGVVTGNGWLGRQMMCCIIRMYYADGSMQEFDTSTASTNKRPPWRICYGPIVEQSIFDGETYDARLERPGWSCAGFNVHDHAIQGEKGLSMVPMAPPGGVFQAQPMEPIRITKSITPVAINEPSPGVYVVDVGQNIAGWLSTIIDEADGQQVTFQFAECLYDNGLINPQINRSALCTDRYIANGKGPIRWEPRFTYHGFRYVQIEGLTKTLTIDHVEAKVVRSSVANRGEVSTDNKLLNQIQSMVWWTEQNNLHGIPTDCPQRDERMGWLNDMTVRSEQALFNFDIGQLYRKWTTDIADGQRDDGAIHDTAPRAFGRTPADPVSASFMITPWLVYQNYGDSRAIRDHYDAFAGWVKFLGSQTHNHIVQYSYYGDWAPPIAEGVQGSIGASAVNANTPGTFMSTGYYLVCIRLMARMAEALGNTTDAADYTDLAERVGLAMHHHFYDETTGGYGSNNQSCNSFALHVGIVPESCVRHVADNLVAAVESAEFHLTTGNICTKHVLEQLSDHGFHDVAYRIATQTTYPSWGFMLENDATTLWERWEHGTTSAMNSHDHPMLGSVGSWFYKYMAGMRLADDAVAADKWIIAPQFVNGLHNLDVSHDSIRGRVKIAWQRRDDNVTLDVHIPHGAQASIQWPDAVDAETLPTSLNAGQHQFALSLYSPATV